MSSAEILIYLRGGLSEHWDFFSLSFHFMSCNSNVIEITTLESTCQQYGLKRDKQRWVGLSFPEPNLSQVVDLNIYLDKLRQAEIAN